MLVRGLALRRARGLGPVTLMSLDNLPSNGHTLHQAVNAFAQALDPALADWIDAGCTFPCSMVDRIVPRTTDADRATVRDALGLDDAWPVMAEPFFDWAVEDRFAAGRPALGMRRRALRRSRAALGTAEAAHGQRHALGDRLPRRDGGVADGRRCHWPTRTARSDRGPDARRDRTHVACVAGPRPRPLPLRPVAALCEPGTGAPHPADRDGRLAEAAATAARHRARATAGRAPDRPAGAGGGRLAALPARCRRTGAGLRDRRSAGRGPSSPRTAARSGGVSARRPRRHCSAPFRCSARSPTSASELDALHAALHVLQAQGVAATLATWPAA